MAESFENLDIILHDWAKDKYKKNIVEALNRYEKHSLAGRRKIRPLFVFFRKGLRKNTRAVGSLSLERDHREPEHVIRDENKCTCIVIYVCPCVFFSPLEEI